MWYKNGFSLSELLIALGIFAIGMIFIAGVFPAGVLFTTIATERTIAAVVADEAFAMVRLCGIDLSSLSADSQTVYQYFDPNNPDIFTYPSAVLPAYPSAEPDYDVSAEKKYSWSAHCRKDNPDYPLVHITVFISRKIGTNTKYKNPFGGEADRPMPFLVEVSQVSNDKLQIIDDKTLINDGHIIIDNETGQRYRVLERLDDIITLDNSWKPGVFDDYVWTIPPPINGGRYPCIAVYQKVISF